jgi:hypothetical protein
MAELCSDPDRVGGSQPQIFFGSPSQADIKVSDQIDSTKELHDRAGYINSTESIH